MKCSNCGTEFSEGVFCPECGTKISQAEMATPVVAPSTAFEDTNNDPSNVVPRVADVNNMNQIQKADEGKVPWYHQMWFISLIFWIGGMFVIGVIASLVLFVIRITKYPSARKTAWISFGVQMGIIVAITALALL